MRAIQRQRASGGTGVGSDFSGIPARASLNAAHGQGGALPHRDAIQKSFGRHDVSSIAAHTGPKSATAARALGAEAFTVGKDVTFSAAPSLHTAAHEAAHAVQQRSGLALQDGVGREGDAHERHADAVADRVVRGQSSETLLDAYAPAAGTDRDASLQMKKATTAYGDFEDVYYASLKDAADKEVGCEMYLRFTPNDKVEADKIGLIQNVKSLSGGAFLPMDDTRKNRTVKAGAGKDTHLDMFPDARSPVYGASVRDTGGDADKMAGWKISSPVTAMSEADQATNAAAGKKGVKYDGYGQYGFRKKKVPSGWNVQSAELDDWPMLPGTGDKKTSGQSFETTALAIAGTQKDTYYGSVQWGWQRDDKGVFSLVDFKAVSQGTPSAGFMAAAGQWNTTKTSGGDTAAQLPVSDVYVTNKAADVTIDAKKVTLPIGTRVQVVSKDAGKPWQVRIVDGANTGATVAVDGPSLTKE